MSADVAACRASGRKIIQEPAALTRPVYKLAEDPGLAIVESVKARRSPPASTAPTLVRVAVEKPERPPDVAVPGEALVIRFRPTDPDSVLRRAKQELKRTGRCGASVFAAVKKTDETDSTLRRRLLAVAELVGMRPEDHPKFYVCSQAEELIRRGFAFYRDGDDDEKDEHYSVDLGVDATRDDAERFLGAFGPAEKRDQL